MSYIYLKKIINFLDNITTINSYSSLFVNSFLIVFCIVLIAPFANSNGKITPYFQLKDIKVMLLFIVEFSLVFSLLYKYINKYLYFIIEKISNDSTSGNFFIFDLEDSIFTIVDIYGIIYITILIFLLNLKYNIYTNYIQPVFTKINEIISKIPFINQ